MQCVKEDFSVPTINGSIRNNRSEKEDYRQKKKEHSDGFQTLPNSSSPQHDHRKEANIQSTFSRVVHWDKNNTLQITGVVPLNQGLFDN